MSRIVGIDLGHDQQPGRLRGRAACPQVIPDAEGRALLPSIVAWTARRASWWARPRAASSPAMPRRTVYSVKRLMGRGYEDVQGRARAPARSRSLPSAEVVRIRIGDREVTPPEVSAHVLRALKARAEAHFGEPVEQAVITVPAYFNDAQRQATKDAGRIAGLDVLRIVNEPTAACARLRARSGSRRGSSRSTTWAAAPSTSRSCASRTASSRCSPPTATRTWAATTSTGRWWTGCWPTSRPRTASDLSGRRGGAAGDPARRRGRASAGCRSTSAPSLTIPFEGFTYRRDIARAELEALIEPAGGPRPSGPCRQALADAGLLRAEQIDEVVLVGGSTRMPLVRRRVQELFGRTPHSQLNPDEVVALGAAVQAQILAGGITDMLLLDVTPLSLGIETLGGIVSVLIPRNTTIPTLAKECFTTSVDGQTAVDMHVVQGERELAKDNRSLARFDLAGIDPMPARHAQDRGDLPHRRQRHPAGAGPRAADRQGRRRSRSSRPTGSPRPRSSRWSRTPSRTRRPTSRRVSSSRRRTRPTPCSTTWSAPSARARDIVGAEELAAIEAALRRAADARGRARTAIGSASGRPRSTRSTAAARGAAHGWTALKGAVTSKRADRLAGEFVMAVAQGHVPAAQRTVEVDDEKYPLADHGRPGLAARHRAGQRHPPRAQLRRELRVHHLPRHRAGGRGEPVHHGAGRGGPPGHRGGPDPPLAARVPGGGAGRRRGGDTEVGRAPPKARRANMENRS